MVIQHNNFQQLGVTTMSMFNNNYPNEIDITTRKITANEVWVDDPDVPGAKVKLGPSSSAELPYYLLENQIAMDPVDELSRIVISPSDGRNSNVTVKGSTSSEESIALKYNSIDFKPTGMNPSEIVKLTRAGAIAAMGLSVISSGTPGANTRLVTYNIYTKAFSHTTIPGQYKHYANASNFAKLSWTDLNTPIPTLDSPACPTFYPNNGDEIFFNSQIGSSPLKYNTWYALKMTSSSQACIVTGRVMNIAHRDYNVTVQTQSINTVLVNGAKTIPQFATAFRIVAPGVADTVDFDGVFILRKDHETYTTLPTIPSY